MQVNFNQKMKGENTQEAQGRTFIAANLIKERVMLDRFGNEIDPKTKQIINKSEDK